MNKWLVGAVGAAAAGAAVASVRERQRDAVTVERAMLEPGPEVELRGDRMRLPISFHRSEAFAGVFGADVRGLTDMLPTDELHPVRIDGTRAAVFVVAYHHREATATMVDGETRVARPYGEVLIAALVTPRPAPPLVPIVATTMFRLGAFVLFLPVTTRLAMEAGRLWNYPKFVADMDFSESEAVREVVVAEGSRRLLTLRVRPAGRPVVDRAPTVLYSERDGRLLQATMPTFELRQVRLGGSGGELELGDHPIADNLRAIGLGHVPIATINVLASRFVMTEGRSLGRARPYRGYVTAERDFGRYTVRRPGAAAVDQYGGLGDAEWTTARDRPVAAPQAMLPESTLATAPGATAAATAR